MIIPYASGVPITMTPSTTGPLTVALIGFGRSVSGIDAAGGSVNLSDGSGVVGFHQAFSMPRNGTITSLSAFFSTTTAFDAGATPANVTAQLYSAPPGSNTFLPIAGAAVVLPLTDSVSAGEPSSGRIALSVPLTVESRVLVAFFATQAEGGTASMIEGYASAGLAIE